MAEIRSKPAVCARSQNKTESKAAEGQPKNKNGNPIHANIPNVSLLVRLVVRNKALSIISFLPRPIHGDEGSIPSKS